MTERVTAWQCIGCGRIEGAQPCVGICQDRKTEFVYATDHDEALRQLARARQACAAGDRRLIRARAAACALRAAQGRM